MPKSLASADSPMKMSHGVPSVVVRDVYKTYTTTSTASSKSGNRNAAYRTLHRVFRKAVPAKVHALRGVNLVAYSGEAVGLLGGNGAGKSTLLRMIAGVEKPTSGEVLVAAQPMILGVQAALVGALSGTRNIELGCLAAGLSPAEVREIKPRIAELADIGDAIDRPMQTYSSGMGARLRFAMNVAMKPDILLIDEALGTGDAAFATKSELITSEILDNAGTIFVVSHAAETIQKMCTRAIWLHKGQIIAEGPAEETAKEYRLWAWKMAHGETDKADGILNAHLASPVTTRITFESDDSSRGPEKVHFPRPASNTAGSTK